MKVELLISAKVAEKGKDAKTASIRSAGEIIDVDDKLAKTLIDGKLAKKA